MTIADWSDFYLMAGGGVAALTGLLFVAMSLHLREILERPELTRNVAIALSGLVFGLLFCGFMLVPGITVEAVGITLIVGSGVFALVYARGGGGQSTLVAVGVCVLDVVVGGLLLAGWMPALYILAATMGLEVAALVRLSWRLLTLAVGR
ncbi:MAG: hypothetical protein ACHQ15_07365 [Candidatus Limnocylindrales bacterium]